MRVPGRIFRICGRSRMLIEGSRNIVTTCALEKSVSNRSALLNVALSLTPAAVAFRFERSTMSGLYSMPCARSPRLAALMTVRPSPDPRSIRKSCGVTLARSSIFSTSAWGVGTQTTSLPACPTVGSNGFAVCALCACTAAQATRTNAETSDRPIARRAFMTALQEGNDGVKAPNSVYRPPGNRAGKLLAERRAGPSRTWGRLVRGGRVVRGGRLQAALRLVAGPAGADNVKDTCRERPNMPRDESPDYYEILQISPTAEPETVPRV